MQLTLNEQEIDVTLEGEKNAFDILKSITSQLEDNIFISSVCINDKYYSPNDEKTLKDFTIERIDHFNIEVGTQEDISVSLLNESSRILQSVAKDLKQNGFSHEKELVEVLSWVLDTIKTIQKVSIFSLSEAKLVESTLSQILDYIQSTDKDLEKIPSLTQILLNLNQYLDSIQLKISNGFNITKEEMLTAIQKNIKILPEIAEAFQVGKDSEAIEKIHLIINLLESCTLYIKKNKASFSKEKEEEINILYDEFNSLLQEVLEAFENTDFILIGDLMEYELPDKLEDYKSILTD